MCLFCLFFFLGGGARAARAAQTDPDDDDNSPIVHDGATVMDMVAVPVPACPAKDVHRLPVQVRLRTVLGMALSSGSDDDCCTTGVAWAHDHQPTQPLTLNGQGQQERLRRVAC